MRIVIILASVPKTPSIFPSQPNLKETQYTGVQDKNFIFIPSYVRCKATQKIGKELI